MYWTKGQVESKFKRIYKAINKALKLTCNSVTPYVGKALRPQWWNQDLSKACAKVRLLIKRQKKPSLHSDLVIARKEYKHIILEAKKQHWQEFSSNADSASKISNLIRSLNIPIPIF